MSRFSRPMNLFALPLAALLATACGDEPSPETDTGTDATVDVTVDANDTGVDAPMDTTDTTPDVEDTTPDVPEEVVEDTGDDTTDTVDILDESTPDVIEEVDLGNPGVCGDGEVNDGEQCDDGNDSNRDDCDNNCLFRGVSICSPCESDGQCGGETDLCIIEDGDAEGLCGVDCSLDAGECLDDEECVPIFDSSDTQISSQCVPVAGCPDPLCGNGFFNGDEECDDGNTVDGDGCAADCTLETLCGNGVVDVGEQCDDGNEAGGDGCSPICLLEALCGDGVIGFGEECDDGNISPGDGCDGACQIEPGCGNGHLEEGEECDDGNRLNGDRCSVFCLIEPYCSDGNLDEGEQCDDGNEENGDGCSDTCRVEARCGDSVVNPGEECDDGNTDDGDDCTSRCTFPAVCGDGEVEDDEECDDGNRFDGDRCSGTCQIEPFCGDGNLDEGEECDDGNELSGDRCSSLCTNEPYCGDGIVNGFEQCDDGGTTSGDGCSLSCTLEWVCGDGDIDPGEECDSEPGCDETTCLYIDNCGDGTLDPGEQCDDGNTDDSDSCNAYCFADLTPLGGTSSQVARTTDVITWRFDTHHETTHVRFATSDGVGGCNVATTLGIMAVGSTAVIESNDNDPSNSPCSLLETTLPPGSYVLGATSATPGARFWLDAEIWVELDGEGYYAGGFVHESNDEFRLTVTETQRTFVNTGDGEFGCPGNNTIEARRFDGVNWATVGLGSRDAALNGCDELNQILIPGDYRFVVADAGENGDAGVANYEFYLGFAGNRCGDGIQTGDEICDDGNNLPWDGCTAACTDEWECGDGFQHDDEACDDNNLIADDGCSPTCTLEWVCGDGDIDPGEACDDGNTVDDDACSNACVVQVPCGNGSLDGDEECDDGNAVDGDGCSSICYIEGVDVSTTGVYPSVYAPGGEQTFTIEVHAPNTRVTLATGTMTECPGDTVLSLTGPGISASNDNHPLLGQCSLLELTLSPGSYTATVSDATAAYVGPFSLHTEVWAPLMEGDNGGGFVTGGGDEFRFSFGSSQSIVLEVGDGAGACPGDSILYLTTDDGTPVEDNDNTTGISPCSRIAELLPAGSYVARVIGKATGGLENYNLRYEASAPGCGDSVVTGLEECEDGNSTNGDGCDNTCAFEHTCGNSINEPGEQCDGGTTCNSACYRASQAVDIGGRYRAGWGSGEGVDYAFTVFHDPSSVTAITSDGDGACPADTRLTLRTAGGATVVSDDNSGIGNCAALQYDALAPGEYVLTLDSPTGAAVDAVLLDLDVYADITAAGNYTGQILPGNVNQYKLVLTSEQTVTLETGDGAGECPADTAIILLDEAHVVMDEDDDSGVDECSLLVTTLPAGTYWIEVEGFAFSIVPPYLLMVSFAAP